MFSHMKSNTRIICFTLRLQTISRYRYVLSSCCSFSVVFHHPIFEFNAYNISKSVHSFFGIDLHVQLQANRYNSCFMRFARCLSLTPLTNIFMKCKYLHIEICSFFLFFLICISIFVYGSINITTARCIRFHPVKHLKCMRNQRQTRSLDHAII